MPQPQPLHAHACCRCRRPSNYDMATSHMLGPVTPDPTMDTTTLDICRTMVRTHLRNPCFLGPYTPDTRSCLHTMHQMQYLFIVGSFFVHRLHPLHLHWLKH